MWFYARGLGKRETGIGDIVRATKPIREAKKKKREKTTTFLLVCKK